MPNFNQKLLNLCKYVLERGLNLLPNNPQKSTYGIHFTINSALVNRLQLYIANSRLAPVLKTIFHQGVISYTCSQSNSDGSVLSPHHHQPHGGSHQAVASNSTVSKTTANHSHNKFSSMCYIIYL